MWLPIQMNLKLTNGRQKDTKKKLKKKYRTRGWHFPLFWLLRQSKCDIYPENRVAAGRDDAQDGLKIFGLLGSFLYDKYTGFLCGALWKSGVFIRLWGGMSFEKYNKRRRSLGGSGMMINYDDESYSVLYLQWCVGNGWTLHYKFT